MRICEGPRCTVDLDPMIAAGQLKSNALVCSGACRAAKSRAKRTDPDEAASVKFWNGMHERGHVRPGIATPIRLRSRELQRAAGAGSPAK